MTDPQAGIALDWLGFCLPDRRRLAPDIRGSEVRAVGGGGGGRGGTHQLLAGLRALVGNWVPVSVADRAARVNGLVPAPT